MRRHTWAKTAIIVTVMVLAVGGLMYGRVGAITYQDSVDVQFGINSTIGLTVSSDTLSIANLAPGSSANSNTITVSVSTNSQSGYYLAATAGTAGGNTNLVNTTSSSNKFTSLATTAGTASSLANITPGYWGYTYSTDGGSTWKSGSAGSTATGYAGLPLDGGNSGSTGVKLLDTNAYSNSGSVQFKIGAKATSTQVVGTYTGTVNFYAVAK